VRLVEARAAVPLPPAEVLELWLNTERWPTFVEGFGHLVQAEPGWPEPGARAIWESIPGGRGRVTERILERDARRIVSEVSEEALGGTQTLRVEAAQGADGSVVDLALEYELTRSGPLREVADAIFIKRALRDSLRRTLRRFAVEAEEEAGLR
jgi:Polyketide cyclase / dehydrase and lipid transport